MCVNILYEIAFFYGQNVNTNCGNAVIPDRKGKKNNIDQIIYSKTQLNIVSRVK